MMKQDISIVTPVYNDWNCFQSLVKNISNRLRNDFDIIHIVVVNDCSSEQPTEEIISPDNIKITRLDLVTNVGHQRAILIGLCHLFEKGLTTKHVIVMDSDGEDKPEDIVKLVNACQQEKNERIIFARRTKRSEGIKFKLFYKVYKLLFILLTGKTITFGNYSCIPDSILSRICNNPHFWNHYSASVAKSKIPYKTISTERGERYFGHSQMNFTNLILHGLSSLSIYIEVIAIRFMKFCLLFLVLLLSGLMVIVFIKYITDYAIPGWSSFLFAIIFNILITVSLFGFIIILQQLNSRSQPLNLPINFYKELIFKKINIDE